MKHHLSIGTTIDLREQNFAAVIHELADLLLRYAIRNNQREQYLPIVKEAYALLDEGSYISDARYNDVIGDLVDALDNFAPPFTRLVVSKESISLHINWDDIKENARVVDDDGLDELPEDYEGYVLHVNDHGNKSLLVQQNGRLDEVWGVV